MTTVHLGMVPSYLELYLRPMQYISFKALKFHNSQSQIQIPMLTANYRNGNEIGIRIGTRICGCEYAIIDAQFYSYQEVLM